MNKVVFLMAALAGCVGAAAAETAFRMARPMWFADREALAKAKTVSVGKWMALDEQATSVRIASDRPVKFFFSWKFVGWIPGDGQAHDFPILCGKGMHEFKLEIPADATYVCAEVRRADGAILAATGDAVEPKWATLKSWFSKKVADPVFVGKEKSENIPLVPVAARTFALAEGLAPKAGFAPFKAKDGKHWLYHAKPGKTLVFKSDAAVRGLPSATIHCNAPGALVVKWGKGPGEQQRLETVEKGGVGITQMDPVVFDTLEFVCEKGAFELCDVGCTTLVDLDLSHSSLSTSDQAVNDAFARARTMNDRKAVRKLFETALGLKAIDVAQKTVAIDPTVRNGLTFCGAKICYGVDEDEVLDIRWVRDAGEGLATDSSNLPAGWKLVRDFDMQAECQRLVDSAVADGLTPGAQFCAYKDGKCLVSVFAGKLSSEKDLGNVTKDTLFPIYSTEKPLLATAVHRVVEQGKMAYDKPLCTWWPELKAYSDGKDGKDRLTLRETLAYRTSMPGGSPGQKGNPVCDHMMTERELCDWDKVCRTAAADKPYGKPGTVQAYLPAAYAWMLGHPLEVAMGKPLNDVLTDEVLKPAGIEKDFYFVIPRSEYPRCAEYHDCGCAEMNEDWARQALLPSCWAVSTAEALCKFYNRLCGFDGKAPLIRKETLDEALKPCRHESDPLPNAKSMKRDWFMLFGMGYGLWGSAERMDRVFGHGGAGGSEALVDRDNRLIVGYTCNAPRNSTVLRDKLYEVVGMRWRYWNDNVNIQDLQMATSARGK